jgi:hypothetical protein
MYGLIVSLKVMCHGAFLMDSGITAGLLTKEKSRITYSFFRPHAPDTVLTPSHAGLSAWSRFQLSLWAIGGRLQDHDVKYAIGRRRCAVPVPPLGPLLLPSPSSLPPPCLVSCCKCIYARRTLAGPSWFFSGSRCPLGCCHRGRAQVPSRERRLTGWAIRTWRQNQLQSSS